MMKYGTSTLFVATDDESIANYMAAHYRDAVNYECHRSGDGSPVHLNPKTMGRQIGEEVLIDALLLSRCQFFVASPSNVSSMVTYWNPELPFVSAMEGVLDFGPGF